MLVSPLGGHDPRPIHKRRLMPHMLSMATGQIRHPVVLFILMIADNGLVHNVRGGICLVIGPSLPLVKP